MTLRPTPSALPITTDIAIIGAGFAGLILARALAGAGFGVTVIDHADPDRPPHQQQGIADDGADGRVFALSCGSRRVLEQLDLWSPMAALAQPVSAINTRDHDAPGIVHFDQREMDEGPLGHIVPAEVLHTTLLAAARDQLGVRFFAPASVTDIEQGMGWAHLNLDNGQCIEARLVVGADGRHSIARHGARINITEWTYDQAAIVTTVTHAAPHGGVAEERFLAGGPFAILPMMDDEMGRHRSSIVWTEPTSRAADLMTLGEDDFNAELLKRFGDGYGQAKVMGPRWTYPLILCLAESYIAQRLALIGDAAHVLHPIAGQGLNLGIRDAAALSEVVVDAHRLGLDYGMKTVLTDYEHWRRFDNTCLAAMTDCLNRVFAVDNSFLRFMRGVGMSVLGRVPPVRKWFMAEAMGINGELPRLVRGEPL
jgi:2-octaprenyl-6-methoxyphenol hydroxylase